MTRFANIFLAVASLFFFPAISAGDGRTTAHDLLPALILWAWERPEDLRFLDPDQVGVAVLAETITIVPRPSTADAPVDAQVVASPRLQPLRVPPGIALVAVARIEIPAIATLAAGRSISQASSGGDSVRDEIARRIAALQTFPGARAIQIDFDARRSGLGFYRALLEDVRRRLPARMPLSITALASWCLGDRWLEELPSGTIDEAVPMLFRMGPDEDAVASWLRAGRDFTVSACRNSIGASTDEPLFRAISGSRASARRLYLFHPGPWTPDAANALVAERRRWNGR